MMCRMEHTTTPNRPGSFDGKECAHCAAPIGYGIACGDCATRPVHDPWANDPDRTTRHHASSITPGGYR
jgi:hypothetical protein